MNTLSMTNTAVPGNGVRRLLDALYGFSAWMAALSMVGLLLLVVAAIAGRQFGFNLDGVDAYAGYSMAAAGFLALAPTLKRQEHIRVTLLTARLGAGAKRGAEIWALLIGVLLAGVFAYFSTQLAWISYDIHDVSSGNDATPLWIPQISMAVGTLILLIALIDELVLELLGQREQPANAEGLRNE